MKDWIEILLRSLSLFFLALALTRIMGKKQLTKITPFYFIVYSVVAILSALISANIIKSLVFGFIALAVWALLPLVLDYMSLKSKTLHDWIHGRETILIKQGKIMEENLKQVRLTGEELLRDLRSKNVFNLADVEFAVLESTGEINVLLKSDKKPVTARDLERKIGPQSEPQTVILDGNILDEPLSTMGLNRSWLNKQLESMGLSLDNIFIGQIDSSGDLYVDLFDDCIQLPQPKVKEMLYANLEKTQADLLGYALQTEDTKAKAMYSNNADKLEKTIQKLKPYLLH